MTDATNYDGREQTLVKHLILSHYLERCAHIVLHKWNSLTYVDCFAGPWNARSEDLADSSFSIALRELRKARKTHTERQRSVRLRCFFLEAKRSAYVQLRKFSQQQEDMDEIEVLNNTFEESVNEIRKFVDAGGTDTFPFFFIDPCGWTGFALNKIRPLVEVKKSEVLINFMTNFVKRFVANEEHQSSFEALFGSPTSRAKLAGLSGLDWEDAALLEYSANLKKAGGFTHVCRAIVLHPEIDRTSFHLVYATHHPKGVEAFKEAERKAMQDMERLRGQAQERRRESKSGQMNLLAGQDPPSGAYYNVLRDRYLGKARARVLRLLRSKPKVAYDKAWEIALSEPLVWESDLKIWIKEWRPTKLEILGLGTRETAPKRGLGHELIWRGGVDP